MAYHNPRRIPALTVSMRVFVLDPSAGVARLECVPVGSIRFEQHRASQNRTMFFCEQCRKAANSVKAGGPTVKTRGFKRGHRFPERSMPTSLPRKFFAASTHIFDLCARRIERDGIVSVRSNK